MRKISHYILAAFLLSMPLAAQAGDRSDAVIGSIIGGATGAVIGNNLGGRDGAIVGGAIGAAAGVAIATDGNNRGYNSGYRNDAYQAGRDHDRRYRRDHQRYDRYRELVVVESPRHYYQGNDFVYGVPPRHDNGRRRGWDDDRHDHHRHRDHCRHDRGRDVVIIQPAPRYAYSYPRYR